MKQRFAQVVAGLVARASALVERVRWSAAWRLAFASKLGAFIAGKSAVFKVDDSGGTLRDLSAYVTNVDWSMLNDLLDTTTFGATGGARTRIAGLRDARFSVSGHWDPTATTGPDAVLNSLLGASASSTFEIGPEGGTTGKIRYTGECYLSDYRVGISVEGLVSFSAEFSVTGNVTRNTF